MSATCRVCHRPMSNPAHIAAGVGPVCAQRAARRASVTDGRAAYPAAKLERINRNVTRLGRMIEYFQRQRDIAYATGTAQEQAEAEWNVRLVIGWFGRWKLAQVRAQRMAARA